MSGARGWETDFSFVGLGFLSHGSALSIQEHTLNLKEKKITQFKEQTSK